MMFLGDCFWASIALRMRSFLWGWRQKIRAGSFKPRDRKWRPTSLWLVQSWKMNCSHSKLPFQRHAWKFFKLDISSMGCLDLHESSPNFLGCGRLLIPADVIAAFLGGKKMQRYAKAFWEKLEEKGSFTLYDQMKCRKKWLRDSSDWGDC